MKRSAKKVLSLLLATVLVLSSVFCITATTERNTVLLSEDFQDLASLNEGDALPDSKYAAASSATWRFATNEAWSSTTSYKVHKKSTDAELMGNGQCIVYNDSAAYAWKNYTLEFKFTIAKIGDAAPTLANPTNRVYYGMTFGIEDPTAPKGLEFAIAYQPSSGNFGYRVYDRVAKAKVPDVTDLAAGKFAFDTEATIKIVVDGKSFDLYLNGEKLGETQTLTRDIVGTIATYMSDNQVNTYYDDIKVTGEEPEEGPLYETVVDEDFSENKKPDNFYATSIVTFDSGAAVLQSPNASINGWFVYNAVEAAAWDTYNLEADIQIGADSEVAALSCDGKGDAYFRATVATKSMEVMDGVEIGIIYNKNSNSWFWRLYDRWNGGMIVEKTAIPATIAGDIGFGKTFHIRVEKDGVKIAVYINNKLLGKGTTAEKRAGSFGFGLQHAFSYASIDNIKVTVPVADPDALTTYLEDFEPGQYTTPESVLALYEPQTITGGKNLAKDVATKYFNTQQNANVKQYSLQDAPDGTKNVIRGSQGNLVYINKSALLWENYTASVDVAFGPKGGTNYTAAADYTNAFRAGIAFAINDLDADPQNRFELYYDGAKSKFNYRIFLDGSDVGFGALDIDASFGDFVNVKVELNGKSVRFYVNDMLVITKTAAANLIGSVALRMHSTKSYAFFKNLLVEGPELAEIDPDEPIPSTKSLFFDDFNKKDGTFSPAEGTWKAAGIAEHLKGKLYVHNTTGIYYAAPVAASWENYTFTTQMMITDKNTTDATWSSSDGTAISGVVFGALMKSDNSGYAGYEFTISYDGSKFNAKLYDRNTAKTLATANDISGITVGEMFLLAVDFKSNLIECFVNGNKVLSYTVVSGDVTKGSIGLLSGTARTKFNYVHVVQGLAPEIDEDTEEPIANENTIYLNTFNETDGDVAAIENCKIIGSFDYVNGRLRNKAFSGDGNLFLYNGAGAASLKNYSVTTEVVLTKKDPATGEEITSGSLPYFGIYFGIGDVNDPFSNAYEATLYYEDDAFYARIYKDYSEKGLLASATKVNGLQLNKAMVLRVDFWEDTINLSINGELVMTYSKPESLNPGTFGLFAGAWRIKYNYIHVEKSSNPDKDEETPIITYVDDDFDSYTDGQTPVNTKNGWNAVNDSCYVKDGKLFLPEAANTNIYAKSTFTNGYVSADVAIEKPSDAFSADGTKYPVWLVGRYTNNTTTGSNEFRIRFALTKKGTNYTAALQTVIYSDNNVNESGLKIPQLESVAIAGFEFGKPINLKLSCIGNYLEVAVDGAVVYQRACDSADALYNHIGQFGISTLGNIASVSLDNVSIKRYNVRNISVDSSCASNVGLATYGNSIGIGPKTVTRNAYYIGEHVVFTLLPEKGYVVDTANLKYTTTSGDTPIVDHKDDVTYGFFMPNKDATIFAAFKQGGSSDGSDVLFSDNFDGEDFMTDRGWSKDVSINMGRAYLPVSETVYLTGLAGCGSWTDYVFEADVSVGDKDDTVTAVNSAVAISAHTAGTSNGYEFGIFMPTQASKGYFRLYNRGTSTTIATTASGTALRGETYSLKMVIEGKRIYCLVDGELVFDVTDDQKTEGSIGLRTNSANAYYDNVVVRKITKADRDEIAGKKPSVDPVKPGPKEEDSPITGEQSVMLILVLCAVSAACAVLVLMAKCRKMTF